VERRVVRRSQAFFEGADGTRLMRRAWLPSASRRALVVVHGFAEHSDRYDRFGAWFAGRDCAVHAYDQRGHGRSEGPRCHVDDFGEFLDDLQRFVELVRREHPGLPLALVGHSMGGLVVSAFLAERKPDVVGAVVSGPALALGDGVPRWRIRLARAARRALPRATLGSGIDPAGLCRDPAVVRAYLDDPLIRRRMTLALATELLDAVTRTAAAGAHVRVPMLLLHGEADPICPARGTRAFHAQLRGPGHRLRVYPKLRHEIFNEPEQEQVFEDVLAWLLGRDA
jgi:alpha-beta hydrolase superfamily lysophospholipase